MRHLFTKIVVATALAHFGSHATAQTLRPQKLAELNPWYYRSYAIDKHGKSYFCQAIVNHDANKISFDIIDFETLTSVKSFTVSIGGNLWRHNNDGEAILLLNDINKYDNKLALSQTLFNTDDKWEFAACVVQRELPNGEKECIWKVMNEDGETLGYYPDNYKEVSLGYQNHMHNGEFRPRFITCAKSGPNPGNSSYVFYSFTENPAGTNVRQVTLQKAMVYPSPLHEGESLNVVLASALDRDAKVEVVDLNGRLLHVSTIKAGDTKTIIPTDLPSSEELIYRITTGDTIISSGKILSK